MILLRRETNHLLHHILVMGFLSSNKKRMADNYQKSHLLEP